MLNLPNLITMSRILLIPLFIIVFWSPVTYNIQLSMLIFAVAGISDILDGYLARKMGMITTLGKVLDPLADKLMVITALVALSLNHMMPVWLVILIIIKEFMLVLGSFFIVIRHKSEIVSANIYGKSATLAVYLAIFAQSFNLPLRQVLTYIAGLAAIIAFLNYLLLFIRNRKTSPL